MRSIVWFRGKDLRVRDHAPLCQALTDGEVIPLFVLDPYFFAPERALGMAHRMQFLLESLEVLERRIADLGSHLVVVAGRSTDRLPELAARWRVDQVLAHRWSEPFGVLRDDRIRIDLEKVGVRFILHEGETLVPPGSVLTGSGSMFHVFTPFARAFARQGSPEKPLPSPESLPPLPSLEGDATAIPTLASLGIRRNPHLPKGGEIEGLQRLADFQHEGLRGYHTARDRMAESGTSRLSSDLHFGTLSVRTVWHGISCEAEGSQEDVACFLNELLWREFAHHLMAEEPRLLTEPFRLGFEDFPWKGDERAWKAWTQGQTGFPVVDAAARQLLAEGYVHNRARMVAASFLTKHLLLSYRRGEAHYLRWLMDGDWANNNMGWQWSAGCGVDAQPWFRIFNPIAQGERFDPEGLYVKRWLPELEGVPVKWIHRPWEAPEGVRKGLAYPSPIVDHGAARARFLAVAKGHLQRRERPWDGAPES